MRSQIRKEIRFMRFISLRCFKGPLWSQHFHALYKIPEKFSQAFPFLTVRSGRR
uniref:Uncharacterized protein n=1 Tax=Picea sitchensis TaxID=3332 RepID=D5ADB6_PICSI|nr:unknown [Picea sitchensis]